MNAIAYLVPVELVLSFGGDIALMFDGNRKAFVVGLALFLSAHIAYAVVFTLLGFYYGGQFLIASGALLVA